MNAIKKLYNGIKNDYSIQRYTVSALSLMIDIEKRYKKDIELDVNIQFSISLIPKALSEISENSKLYKDIISFSKELNINLETLKNK